ncbi:MAG: WbqC family protein [Elusimicrobia bacterium]|nr:WbqC family protein [Elusimicrobiota bacterium]
MRLSAHQLQYMPGLRFFSKMKGSDLFIYLDDVQYEKREFQNRNRIRTKDGRQYLTVPAMVKGKFSQNINTVEINSTREWRGEHLRAVKINYARSKYLKEYLPALEALYAKNHVLLGELASATVAFLKDAFGIETPVRFSSEFKLASASTQRLVDLCSAAGADEYLSGAGAREYLDEELFVKSRIRLSWQDFNPLPYPQAFEGFMPDLSALDLLLNCGPDSVKYL